MGSVGGPDVGSLVPQVTCLLRPCLPAASMTTWISGDVSLRCVGMRMWSACQCRFKGNALGQASNSTGITGLARSWLRLSPRLREVDFRLASAPSSPAVISPPRVSSPIHCHPLPLTASASGSHRSLHTHTHTQASLSSLPVHALLSSLCLADLLLPLTVVVVVVVFTRLAAFTTKSG